MSLSSTGIRRMSFSLLFSWTLTAYYGREGSLNDFLLAQNVDILLQTVYCRAHTDFSLKVGGLSLTSDREIVAVAVVCRPFGLPSMSTI